MTDFASRDPDQLASDLVDGLVPPDDAARLRSDPDVAARVARIEALRSALRSTPPAPPPIGALDRMVAAAVDAAAPGSSGSSGSGAGSVPRHLQPVPPRSGPSGPPGPTVRPPVHHAPPTPLGRKARPWLAAAAAVLVGLAFAGLLAQGGGDDADQATSAADSSERSQDEAGATFDDDGGGAGAGDAAEEGTGSADAPATAEPGGPDSASEDDGTESGSDANVLSADLGSVDSAAELADRVRAERAAMGTTGAPPATPGELASSCPAFGPQGDLSRGTATYTAEAELQGEPVTVHVYESGAGARLVATDASCTDVVDVPYED